MAHHNRYLRLFLSGLAAGLLLAGLTACGRTLPLPPTSATEPVRLSLAGTVYDTASKPVAGARVEVVSQTWDAATTDASGRFTVTGTARPYSELRLQATGVGYAPATRSLVMPSVSLTLPHQTLTLAPAEPLDLSGQYTLAVIAADACGSLPSIARHRTYDASITRHTNLTSFTLTLGGATFLENESSMVGSTALNFVRFTLGRVFDPIDQDVLIEDVGDGYVSLFGSVSATVNPADPVIRGTFDGDIRYCSESLSPAAACAASQVECTSKAHQVILSRK